MDPQTKKEIIDEISSTATKTIEEAGGDSLERALPDKFLDETTYETINGSNALPSLHLEVKDARYFTKRTTTFSKKLMMLSIPLKKDTSTNAKKNWRKSLILKKQREEDGWEAAKWYLSDDLASHSEDVEQLNKTLRDAASNKKKWEASKLKNR